MGRRVKNPQFYLISSLPHEITSAISGWALRNSVLLDGVYSLPYALTCLDDALVASSALVIIIADWAMPAT